MTIQIASHRDPFALHDNWRGTALRPLLRRWPTFSLFCCMVCILYLFPVFAVPQEPDRTVLHRPTLAPDSTAVRFPAQRAERIQPSAVRQRPSIPAPDTLIIGGFHLLVDQNSISSSGHRLSGKATGQFLAPAPCSSASTKMAVEFQNGQINISGPTLYSAYDFEVSFTDLQTTNWPPHKSEKVASGSIDHAFTAPLQVALDDFAIRITRFYANVDSVYIDLQVSPPGSVLSRSGSCRCPAFEGHKVPVDEYLNFSFTQPAFHADSLIIGNTGILFRVRGLQVLFDQNPRKMIFDAGETLPQKPLTADNSAFLYAPYYFTNGQVIACEGFTAKLNLSQNWQYEMLTPMSYAIELNRGSLVIEKSWVDKGHYSGSLSLPAVVGTKDGDPLRTTFARLDVDSSLNTFGKVGFGSREKICWGNFELCTDSASVFFPGISDEFSFTPLDTAYSTSPHSLPATAAVQQLHLLPGLVIDLLQPSSLDTFRIRSLDMEQPLTYNLHQTNLRGWLNLSTRGMTGHLVTTERMKLFDAELGLTNGQEFKSETPFAAAFWHDPDSLFWSEFQFVRNAVYHSYLGGYLTIPYPCDLEPKLKNLKVTSTAELVGGDVFFQEKALSYWGVKMTAEKRGNILSADLGEIVYMNSKISEKIHFAQPFKILWGEMLADGGLDKIIFDLGSPQTFDGFSLTLHSASLSKYDDRKSTADDDTLGYLRAYGDLHFDFFGAHKMDVRDYKDARSGHGIATAPYYGRFVALNKKNCQLDFDKSWGASTARMIFTVDYDNNESSGFAIGDQNGFRGAQNTTNLVHFWLTTATGKQTLIPDDIDLNSVSTYFLFCDAGPLKLISADATVDTIGGLIQIQGDVLKRIYLEGLANLNGWTFNKDTRASLEITPSTITSTYRGVLSFMVIKCGLLGMVNSRMVVNKSKNSLEGDLNGVLQAYGGGSNVLLAKSSDYLGIEATGRLNYYISPDTNYVQGYASISLEWGIDVECEGAFFAGIHAPVSKLWVLDTITRGPSIKDGLAERFDSLSGFYCAGLFGYGYDFTIFEARFAVYAGLGFFAEQGSLCMIGHGGVEVEATLLGGVASASAWTELYNLNIVGTDAFEICLQGTVGLEACVVFMCATFDFSFHFGTGGIGLGGC